MSVLKAILIKEIIYPILIILFCVFIYFILKSIIKRMFKLKTKRINAKKQNTIETLILNILKYFIIIVAILMILSVYNINTTSLIASLGIVGLVAGLAVQDTLKDFVSGISIIFEEQYCVGDTVSINDFKGEVIFLGIKSTKIKALSGEIMFIPNHLIEKVINYSIDSSLAIIDIDVAYESNLDKVEKALTEMCNEQSKLIKELKGEIQLLGIQELASSSIKYRIIAQTTPMNNFLVERIIRRETKKTLDKYKIDIPYSQLVVHNAK